MAASDADVGIGDDKCKHDKTDGAGSDDDDNGGGSDIGDSAGIGVGDDGDGDGSQAQVQAAGAGTVTLICLLAAPEGIEALRASGSVDRLVTASIDSHLNEVGFIVPGLGDAGDRQYGVD